MDDFYAIAYLDKDGNGFSSTEPWIHDSGEVKQYCIDDMQRLQAEGCTNLTPFICDDDLDADDYNWDYVVEHCVDLFQDHGTEDGLKRFIQKSYRQRGRKNINIANIQMSKRGSVLCGHADISYIQSKCGWDEAVECIGDLFLFDEEKWYRFND